MRNVRSLRFWGIFLAIAAVAVFAAAAFEPGAQVSPRGPLQPLRPGIDKIRPIAFEIGQDSALTKKCAAKVESDNAMLATMLAEMRLDIAAGKAFDRAAWERRMATTYLKDPVITTEDGQPHPGWANVFDVLTGIVGRSTYIDAQSVHVNLEYLAYKSPEYIRFNGLRPERRPGEDRGGAEAQQGLRLGALTSADDLGPDPIAESDEVDNEEDRGDDVDRVVDALQERGVAPAPARVELGQGVEERDRQQEDEPLSHQPGLSPQFQRHTTEFT
jgi:hypothetical protein